ncbi:MAG: beta-galactosidase trimerization domain-containing protein [Verrucomicrobia bacterium]|nr:beta-galactosidase trimerization domain-containing protein [Verrucomicrobiota bacterium]
MMSRPEATTDPPFRQVRLDFDTSPAIPEVGADFDAEEFARTLTDARVEGVILCAKCRYGHLYLDTTRPERHPGLRADFDLLNAQVAALRRANLRVSLSISILCDEFAANAHPDWVARELDGRPCFPPGIAPPADVLAARPPGAWQVLDLSSPYAEYLAAQVAETLEKSPLVDGVWFDAFWNQPSLNPHAIAAMRAAGLHPERAPDRQIFAQRAARKFMQRLRNQVLACHPAAEIFFNERPIWDLAEELPLQSLLAVCPPAVLWARAFPKTSVGMTTCSLRGAGDFGSVKSYPTLEAETSFCVAHGARCLLGDPLHPRGRFDATACARIGRAFARVEAREPWLRGARAATEIGVLQVPGEAAALDERRPAVEGAARLLAELQAQFDLIGPEHDFTRYRLLVLPDSLPIESLGKVHARLGEFLRNGGALLATGTAGLSGTGASTRLLELGVVPLGMSPFSTVYFRAEAGFALGDPAATDHVLHGASVRVVPLHDAQRLASIVEPYFERGAAELFSPRSAPPQPKVSDYAAVVENGHCTYVAFPLFTVYAEQGDRVYRQLVAALLTRLLPAPQFHVANAPTTLVASLMHQENERRWIVHFLHYPASRHIGETALVADVVPLHEVAFDLALPQPPRAVYLAPEHAPLAHTFADGRVRAIVPEVRGHAMVVLEM